jgi:C-terminal processing protease CtpA/Prc
MRNKKIIVSIISIILVTTTTAFYLGFNLGTKNIADADLITTLRNKTSDGELKLFSQDVQLAQTVDFAPFWKTWEVLDKNYIPVSTSSQDMIPDDKKVIKAIQGLVSSYNDPYTIFFSPEEAKIFKEQTDGSFEGIGAILRDINGSIIVENLLKDMPAQKAGIKPGDTILSIDKKKILGMDLQQVVKMIRGPKDSVVIIKVKHMKQIVPVDIKVTRGKVSLPSTTQAIVSKVEDSVKRVINQIQSKAGAILSNNDLKSDDNGLYDSIGAKDFYVFGLTTFSKSSTEAFREEVLNFNKSETNNIIFDLRNNGGL